jgi:hypothetical protein
LMMAFSSVSVVTSSLLLRRYQRPKIQEDGTLLGGGGCLMVVERAIRNVVRWLNCCTYTQYETVSWQPDVEIV